MCAVIQRPRPQKSGKTMNKYQNQSGANQIFNFILAGKTVIAFVNRKQVNKPADQTFYTKQGELV
jgi:hypothetical protein